MLGTGRKGVVFRLCWGRGGGGWSLGYVGDGEEGGSL